MSQPELFLFLSEHPPLKEGGIDLRSFEGNSQGLLMQRACLVIKAKYRLTGIFPVARSTNRAETVIIHDQGMFMH